MTIFEFKSFDLAAQLTLIDLELFKQIEVIFKAFLAVSNYEKIINILFSKLNEILSWSLFQNESECPNLVKFTQHFNKFSFW